MYTTITPWKYRGLGLGLGPYKLKGCDLVKYKNLGKVIGIFVDYKFEYTCIVCGSKVLQHKTNLINCYKCQQLINTDSRNMFKENDEQYKILIKELKDLNTPKKIKPKHKEQITLF